MRKSIAFLFLTALAACPLLLVAVITLPPQLFEPIRDSVSEWFLPFVLVIFLPSYLLKTALSRTNNGRPGQ